jgi:hypothetical protein
MRFEHDPNMPALRREWFTARVLGTLGLLFVFAVAAAGIYLRAAGVEAPSEVAAPPPPQAAPADDGAARRAESIAICDAALAEAQHQGLVPAYARRDSDEADNTAVQGRYTCSAKTDAARYGITFDLQCTRLGQPGCINLFTVEQVGSGVLYQRK